MSDSFGSVATPADPAVEEELTKTLLYRRLSALEAELAETKKSAETDRLTLLGNRALLERRTNAREGWFVLCDLDGFKSAQDAHPGGHAYGDLILMEFADFLRSVTRAGSDRVSVRLGGDEFVVWTPSWDGATRIKLSVREWISEDCMVSASAGLGRDLGAADAAMYMDKRAKKWRRLRQTLGVQGLADAVRKALRSLS